MKLHWRLLKTKNLNVPVSTIGKILKQEGLVRKYRKKKIKYKYIKAKRKPGELVEIDVKHVPGRVLGRKYYQYKAFTNYYLGTNKRSDMTVKTIHVLDNIVLCTILSIT